MPGVASHLFIDVDRKASLYQRSSDSTSLMQHMETPSPVLHTSTAQASPSDTASNLRHMTERAILRRYAPACAVVNERGDLYYTLGRTGFYLEPPEGEMSTNILHMAREGLRLPLTSALRHFITRQQEVMLKSVQVQTNGDTRRINLVLQPLEQRGLLLIIFEEVPAALPTVDPEELPKDSDPRDARIQQLEHELQAAHEYLQVTTEELDTTNEEIRSANEELQSSNEELQSTNEELETSKEELQSMHEEQMTVNAELRGKIDQVEQANNDLRNLLASVEVGVIFLDMELHIKRFTPIARRVISLREADIGRPLGDLAMHITNGGDLAARAEHVLDTLEHITEEVQTEEDEWYLMRIMPYRTKENIIEGVTMTFSNITQQRRDRDLIPHLLRVAKKSAGMIMMTDAEGNIEYVNPHLLSVTGYSEAEIIGQTPRMFQVDEEGIEQYEHAQQQALAGQESRAEFRQRHKDGNIYWISASFSPVYNSEGRITNMVIAEEDISERKQASAARTRMNRLLAALGDWHRQAAAGDAQEASSAMCRLLVEAGGYRGAWVGLAVPDAPAQVQPLAQAGYDAAFLQSLPPRWHNAEAEDSPLRAVLLENQPHTHYNRSIIFPIQAHEHTLGVLVVASFEAPPVAADETETLRILAANLAAALQMPQSLDSF